MADEKTQPKEAALTDTEKMHKFARDQINQSREANRKEREKRIADANREAEEVRAKFARKHAQAELPAETEPKAATTADTETV